VKSERVKVILFLILGLLFFIGGVGTQAAEEKPSPELLQLGKELFTTKEKLGVKYACILCHQQEKAIKKSTVQKLGDKLPDVINQHLLQKAKGTKALNKDSPEMKALVAYIVHKHSV